MQDAAEAFMTYKRSAETKEKKNLLAGLRPPLLYMTGQKRYDHRTKQMFLKWGPELTARSTAAARRGRELAFWASLRPAQLDFRLGQVVCLKQRLHLWAKSAAQPSPYREICPSSREVIS